jgi:nicotinamide riboside kinase
MRTRVVNLTGGPGSGKSTTAAGLFFEMKTRDKKVELVTEFAKELTYEGRLVERSDQRAILHEQQRRLDRLVGKVDWIITDSPLFVGLVYGQGYFATEAFERHLMRAFNSYENVNVFVDRAKPYQGYGRTQGEDEARQIDGALRGTMCRLGIEKHLQLAGLRGAPTIIANHLERTYAE